MYINVAALIGRLTPQGACLASDSDVATYFLEEARVNLVPGQAFGLSPYLRLSYAADTPQLQEALRRLQQAIQTLISGQLS